MLEQDLPRTFPRNTWVPNPEGLQALRSVLVAYSAHNPDVGYCQVRGCWPRVRRAEE